MEEALKVREKHCDGRFEPLRWFKSIIAMVCLAYRILSFSYMHDKSIDCRLKFEFVAMELLRLLN